MTPTPGSHMPTQSSTFPTCKKKTLPPTCKASGMITCGRCTIHGRLNWECTCRWLSMQCPEMRVGWDMPGPCTKVTNQSWVPGAYEEVVNAMWTR